MDKQQQQQAAAASLLTAALAPAMAVGMADDHPHHPRHHANPFGIKALKEEPHNNDAKDSAHGSSSTKRPSRRSRLKERAGRSLSPFRLRYPRSSKKKNGGGDDDADDSNGGGGADSDAESIASSTASGITPRNNAFSVEDPDDEPGPSSRRASSDGHRRLIDARDESERYHRSTDDEDDGAHASSDRDDDDDVDGHHDEDEEDEDDDDDFDPELLDNTLFNAGCLDLHEDWVQGGEVAGGAHTHHHDTYIDENLEHDDDEHITAPNVVLAEQQVGPHVQRRGSKTMSLNISRPLFERNRCTITLVHGDYARAAKESKRPKRYIVASDGSEESSYAIEWTIGTVLRDGDETLVVSVMETDTKLDAADPAHESHQARMEHQRTRQGMASVLARQATHLLERTRLEVRISCQAIHAKNSRHMLLDLIDFYAPTMVVVGSRGLGSLRGILLGSTSHYLVQKSSAPVMVARKRLKLPALPRGKGDVVQSVRMRHMRLDQAAVEKKSNVTDEAVKKEQQRKADGDGDGDGGKKDDAEGSSSKDTAPAPTAAGDEAESESEGEGEGEGEAADVESAAEPTQSGVQSTSASSPSRPLTSASVSDTAAPAAPLNTAIELPAPSTTAVPPPAPPPVVTSTADASPADVAERDARERLDALTLQDAKADPNPGSTKSSTLAAGTEEEGEEGGEADVESEVDEAQRGRGRKRDAHAAAA